MKVTRRKIRSLIQEALCESSARNLSEIEKQMIMNEFQSLLFGGYSSEYGFSETDGEDLYGVFYLDKFAKDNGISGSPEEFRDLIEKMKSNPFNINISEEPAIRIVTGDLLN